MKVGFLSIHPPSASPGTENRIKGLCEGLSKLGHRSIIFTPFEYSYDWGEMVEFQKIPAITSSSGIASKVYNMARKVLNTPFFSRHLIIRKKTINSLLGRLGKGVIETLADDPALTPDCFIGTIEIPALALARVKEELAVPVLADYHNFWPEELFITGVVKARASKKYDLIMEFEKELVRKADHVLTVTQFLKDYLVDHLEADPAKITPVPIGGTPVRVIPAERETPPRVVYSGAVAPRANLELFIDAISHVKQEVPEATFHISRKGDQLANLQKYAKRKGVTPDYFWFDDFNAFLDFLAKSSVGILTSSHDLPAQFGAATKMYDYFASGVPVVANDIGSWTKIVETERAGVLTSDDPREFAKAIVKVLKDPSLGRKLGQAGIELVEKKYNILGIVKERLMPVLDDLVNLS